MSKALLVDDSKTVRIIGRRIMSANGFDVVEAEHGQEALEVFRSHPDIDVILLDWNMPVMNGIDFLVALRSLPLPKQPYVIMCTTENDMEHITQALSAGANEYVMKPFTEEMINEKLTMAGAL